MQDLIDRLVDDYDRGGLSRRQLIAGLTAAATAAILPGRAGAQSTTAPAAPPKTPPTFHAVDLNHIALRVTDIPRSKAFYEKHLGLEMSSQSRTSCFMRCRDRDFLAMFKSDKAGLHHYCYSVEGYTAASAMERLKEAGLKPRQRGERVYFDDPDGIECQVAAPSHNV